MPSIPGFVAVIVAGVITTLYSAFGGIRSVTFTDILQFGAFGVVIPVVGYIVWVKFVDNGLCIDEAFENHHFNLIKIFSNPDKKLLSTFVLFIYFMIPYHTFLPVIFQRISISRDIHQAQKSNLITVIVISLIQLSICWISFLMYNIDKDLLPNQLLAYIIDNYTHPDSK